MRSGCRRKIKVEQMEAYAIERKKASEFIKLPFTCADTVLRKEYLLKPHKYLLKLYQCIFCFFLCVSRKNLLRDLSSKQLSQN